MMPPLPSNFEANVRVPGMIFLSANPNPTKTQWKAHRYWQYIHEDMHKSLKGICSYCGSFTPFRSGGSGVDHTSIDHYIPKSIDKTIAYEWSNYRLCRTKLNVRKDNFLDVLDPYCVNTGDFRINFSNFFIFPADSLEPGEKIKVEKCIARLQLNSDDSYVNERMRVVYSYAQGRLPMTEVERYYPFIASELILRDFDAVHLPVFVRMLENPVLKKSLIAQGVIDE